MKLEGVTLELDDTATTLEELAVQLQAFTPKVLLVKNDVDLEVIDLEKIEPLKEWVHVETEKTPYGSIYTVRRISEDTGRDDESFDDDGEDTVAVFREDAFRALTSTKVKAAKTEKKKKNK